MRDSKYVEAIPDELKDKIVTLKVTSYKRGTFESFTLEKLSNVCPKQVRRVCDTNYKYICVARVGNLLTYFVTVSNKSFKWYASFSEINEAVVSIKRKYAEYNLPIKSIKRY